MRNALYIAAVCSALALSGCAGLANSVQPVTANVNAAVQDTNIIGSGTVAIITDIAKTAAAILSPITYIIGLPSSL